MLLVGSALKGYAISATDGVLGTVSDMLFDDVTWRIKWLVVDTGGWLSGRKVLLHPSVITAVDYDEEQVQVLLTKSKITSSPDIMTDAPVSMQMQSSLYDYYGWDPYWGGGSYFGGGAIAYPLSPPPYFGSGEPRDRGELDLLEDADPHLRSIQSVKGDHIEATDGAIGHIAQFVIDDTDWGIRYLVVDTSNWWIGQHVLISPYAVREIAWSDSKVWLNVSRAAVRSSPAWDPAAMVNRAYERELHQHYGWAGYGW